MLFKVGLQYYIAFTAGTLLAIFLTGCFHVPEKYLALMYSVALLCYILQDACAVLLLRHPTCSLKRLNKFFLSVVTIVFSDR